MSLVTHDIFIMKKKEKGLPQNHLELISDLARS